MLRKSEQTYDLSPSLTRVIVLAPFLIVLLSLLFRQLSLPRYPLAAEYRPTELVTFASLLAAGLLGLGLGWRVRRIDRTPHVVGFYAVFSIGVLIAAMEEVSWGQWIFGFEPPAAVKAINTQEELNLHNLPGLHVVFESLRVAFGIGGLFGVWLSSRPQTRSIGAPAILSSWFVLIALIAALDLRNSFVPPSGKFPFEAAAGLVEALELMIGLSAFLYIWLNGRRFSISSDPSLLRPGNAGRAHVTD